MEFVLTLGLLYAVQCLAWLPGGAVLFVRPLRAWVISRGPGWRTLHPFPAGRATRAAPLPLVEREGRLYAPAAPTWLQSGGASAHGTPLELAALADARARGRAVRLPRRTLAVTECPERAEELAGFLRRLADASPAQRREQLAARLSASLSLAAYRDARRRSHRATRWLAWSSSVYWLALFAGLPCALRVASEELVLALGLPVLGGLHALTLLCLGLALARLRAAGSGAGALFEPLLSAALYPPLLLRASHDLRARALAGFHPAVVAAAELSREGGRAFLRGEILALARRSSRAGAADAEAAADALGLDELEGRGLWELARELGESPATLLAPPAREDPLARAYCPACRCEYRRASGPCSGCDADLVGFDCAEPWRAWALPGATPG